MSGAGESGYFGNNHIPLRRGFSSHESRGPPNRHYHKDRNFSDTTASGSSYRNYRQSPDSHQTEEIHDAPNLRRGVNDGQRRPWSLYGQASEDHSDEVFDTPRSSENTRPASLLDELFKDRPFTRLSNKKGNDDDFFGDISDRFKSLFDKADDIFSKRITDKDDNFFSKIKGSADDKKELHLFDKEPDVERKYSYRRHSDQDSDQENSPVRRRRNRRNHQNPNNRHSWADFDSKGYPDYKRQASFSQKTYKESHTGYSSGEDSDSVLSGSKYERGKPRKRGSFKHRTFSESVEKFQGEDGKVHTVRRSSNSGWTDKEPKGNARYGSLRNLFDRFGFKFGSFGTYSDEKEQNKREYFFCDFEDFINNFRGMKEDFDPISRLRRNTKARNFSGNDSQGSDSDCQYTCHHRCRPMVTLDCKSISADSRSNSGIPRSDTSLFDEGPPKKDDADSGYNSGRLTKLQPSPGERTLTRNDLRNQIEAFNENQHGLVMNLHDSDITFQGFIRVHMNLIRPISMSIATRPPSIYEVLTSDDENSDDTMSSGGGTGTGTTSFYLPKDTTKVIHIKSDTTTQEVIRALLHKFKITDNPRKFALYEKTGPKGKKGTMRKLQDMEHPLPLCLSWGTEGLDLRRYVLQENDTMEIVWDAFSLPELDNFLRILDREELEYVDQVKAKYALMKLHIKQRLKEVAPPSEAPSQHVTPSTPTQDKREPVFV